MKTLKFLLIAMLAILSTHAVADEKGFFVNAETHIISIRDLCKDVKNSAQSRQDPVIESCSDSELGLGLAGGYRLNEFLALESRATFVGKLLSDDFYIKYRSQYGTYSQIIDYKSIALGGQGRYPVSDNMFIVARGGLHKWELEPLAGDGIDPYFGIGIDFEATDNLNIEAGYTIYETNAVELDTINFRVNYNFRSKGE